MPKRALLLAGVALVVLTSCVDERSNLDRDAAVTVRGTLQDVDGAPLASRPVRLGSGVSVLEGGAGVLTVGLFCLTGECSGDFFDDRSGEDGSFEFELTGADAQSTFGEAVSFLLSASGEPDAEHPAGPAVSARFRIQTDQLTLPALRLVDPGLQVGPEGTTVSATWDATAPAPYALRYATPDGVPVWETSAAEPAAAVDGRVLEDVTGLATVGGSRTDAIEGSDLIVSWRSSSVAFRGGLGAPPSRGARCELRSGDGLVVEVDGCGLTDGSYQRAGIPTTVCPEPSAETATTRCAPVERVRLHLPSAVPADLLVVRGCTDPCRAAVVGADGAATDVGPISGGFATVALGGAPVSAVDVITGDVASLAEVSAWAPASDGPSLLPIEDPGAVGPSSSGETDSTRWGVVAVAAVLLVGVVVLAGRTRRALATR